MTDLEMTRLCAVAMGLIPMESPREVLTVIDGSREFKYIPLHDDAQCMALIKQLEISIYRTCELPTALLSKFEDFDAFMARTDKDWRWTASKGACGAIDSDLNQAVVKCAAAWMQAQSKIRTSPSTGIIWVTNPVL